ncbi:hypothetical protein VOLCADRAFT_86128 [Volvox carteri f. nagariensis]|uniref:Uncharacterized protein n=1 Tax=Volvox carteri f. nagariensis TaxID=3068 RepID=D8THY4_VOLCA|nr:uncharacterized protein VOLCADRAFT_86128 [Volvox carteri f. nagariensis]EFJ52797.1 hypothetical protein VOLCADRAFT_86128 [Volvox carteri f. nagariensis]|eukprot:XP_002945802.1 hypothetical protein VOLCADRAFT_86128 [Volvox carteri f. nagariensis]
MMLRLLTPEVVNVLQKRISDTDLPGGLSADEAQAHRLARMLLCIDVQCPVDHVRGCASLDDSLRLLTSLAQLAASHQQYTREAAAASTQTSNTTIAAAATTTTTTTATTGRAPSPVPQVLNATTGSTPRHRTPPRGNSFTGGGVLQLQQQQQQQDPGGGGVGVASGSGAGRLNLGSLDGEFRLLDGLAERLPQLLEAGGGGNWFPGDIIAALQTYMQTLPHMHELVAAVDQRSQKLRGELPALRAEEARLAAEVTVAGEAEWQRHAEATRAELANLLDSSAAFFRTFQTGLGVWCAASRATDTCGLGPLASELLQRYDVLRRLGADLARIRQAHTAIVSCAPPLTLLEQHTLSQLVRAGQTAVEQLQERIAVEQRVMAETEATGAAAAAAAARGAAAMAHEAARVAI